MTDAAFWDRIAPRYSKRPITNMEAYETTMARTESYLKGSDRALELGCGTGSTALRLAANVAEYTGADISAGMIAIANAKVSDRADGNLDFVQAGVEADTFNSQSYDVVLAFNLLHLLPDPEAGLAVIRDLLPVGGLFISKTPCIGAKWYFRPLIAVMQALGKAPHVLFLRVPELDRIVTKAGFEIVETGLYPPSGPSRFLVARKV